MGVIALAERVEDQDLLQRLAAGLRSLDGCCLDALERGLAGMASGDFTVVAEAVTEPIGLASEDADVRALVDVFNAMLHRTQAALEAYERLRVDLNQAFGDQSCLPELTTALTSLNDHCLADLDVGLQAMAEGDMTRLAHPVTRPLRARPGDSLGALGEVFNDMLARSRTALRSYDAVREDLRAALGDRSCLDDLRLRLRSLQRHCLRDLEEALEAQAEGTTLTREIAPSTKPLIDPGATGVEHGELAVLFDRALVRAQAAVTHLRAARDMTTPRQA
jgi:hypothetical protein